MSRSTRTAPVLAALALLLAVAAPVAAENPDRSDCAPTLASLGLNDLEALLFAPVAVATEGGAGGGPTTLASCTAYCQTGSVSCSGTSCSAVDANCSQDQRGYCTGSSGTTYCPPCEACDDSTLCQYKNGSPCSPEHATSDCSFSDGSCGSCFCRFGSWICTL